MGRPNGKTFSVSKVSSKTVKIMNAEENRRLFERFMARFPVKLQSSRAEFGVNTFLRNVSANGIRFITKQEMFLKDSIALLVELPDGFESMLLTGRVMWTKKKTPASWDVGMEFHKTHLMKMQRIYRLLEPMV